MVASSATFSGTGFATATTTAKAAPGTYPLFVEQVASASQVVFTDLPAVPVPVTGTLSISQGGIAAFDVDFSTADIDGNGTLSQAEMARAINSAADNKGKVTASVLHDREHHAARADLRRHRRGRRDHGATPRRSATPR